MSKGSASLPPTSSRCLIDGVAVSQVQVTDRGLHYGDGLFETLLVRDGRPCQWTRHWGRLALGCGRLGMPVPDPGCLRAEVAALLEGCEGGVLKLLLTRGDGGRGYRVDPQQIPRRVLTIHPNPDYPDRWSSEGVSVRLCRTPASSNPVLAGLKHLNRLDNVLARAEWSDPHMAEGLMTTQDGTLVGGTMSNLFVWDGTRLSTPSLDQAGIAGTVRSLTLELAAGFGIPVVSGCLGISDLFQARGLFLTNSVLGVWPVRQFADHAFDPAELPMDLLHAVQQAAWGLEESWP